MIEAGWTVAIGHGNGPRLDSSCGDQKLPPRLKGCMKSAGCVRRRQPGAIGYSLQQTLQNELKKRKIVKSVTTDYPGGS